MLLCIVVTESSYLLDDFIASLQFSVNNEYFAVSYNIY